MGKEINKRIQEYLEHSEKHYRRLVDIDTSINQAMSEQCKVSVILPAYNEELEIERILREMLAQTYGEEVDVCVDNFELIIVNNNSTDRTGEVALDYIKNNHSPLRIHIVNVTFEEDESGCGAARKLGGDLSLYRAMKSGHDMETYCIANLDVDNEVPKDHFYKILTTVRKTKADVLLGRTSFDRSIFSEDKKMLQIADTVEEYRRSVFKEIPSISILTSQNNVMRAMFYVKAGGYPEWKMADDLFIAMNANFDFKIAWLESTIRVSVRNIIDDPFEILTREVWDRNRWGAEANARRGKGKEARVYDFNDEYIKNCLTTFLDDYSSQVFSQEVELSYEQVLFRERKHFHDIAVKHHVDEQVLPDISAFNIGKYSIETVRSLSLPARKQKQLERELAAGQKISEQIPFRLIGQIVLRLKDAGPGEGGGMPDVLTYAVEIRNFRKLSDILGTMGYELFQIVRMNKLKYYKRFVYTENKNMLMERNQELYALTVDKNRIPYIIYDDRDVKVYKKNCFKIELYEERDGMIQIQKNEVFRFPAALVDETKEIKGIKCIGNVMSLLYCELYEKKKKSQMRELFCYLTEEEQGFYNNLRSEMIGSYTAFIDKELRKLSGAQEQEAMDSIFQLAEYLIGRTQTRKDHIRLVKISEQLIDLIKFEEEPRKAGIGDILKNMVFINY